MSNKPKFTPGPWEIKTCLTGYAIDAKAKGLPFDRICMTRATYNQDYANANLISASPDMYEALKECLSLFALGVNAIGKNGIFIKEKRGRAREIEQKVLKALAKAQGGGTE